MKKFGSILTVLALAAILSVPSFTSAQTTTDTGATVDMGTPGMPATGADSTALALMLSSGAIALGGIAALGSRKFAR